MNAWEDVTSRCPKCRAECGTIFNGDNDRDYRIPAHGRMGNKSFREDPAVGTFCDCGHTERRTYTDERISR